MKTGYLLIEYSNDGNSYDVFLTRQAAEQRFVKKAKEYAKAFNEPEVLANDQDDMEELAAGGIYSPNHELVLEIVECTINSRLDVDR